MILRVLHPTGSTALLFLQGPITVIEAQTTMSRLCDATGREYFFNADGTYDGFGQAMERTTNADAAEILSSERSTSDRPRDPASSEFSAGRAAALDAAPSPQDFARLFVVKLAECDWLSAPEVRLEADGDVGFDWDHDSRATISAHISATGRAGWAALIGAYKSHGWFQWPDWPDDLTEAFRLFEAAALARSAPAETKET